MADNFNTCDSGGGGGGSSALFVMPSSDAGGMALEDSSFATITWKPTFGGGAYTIDRGEVMSWSAGEPTKITVETTGYYDISFTAVLNDGTDECAVQAALKINGSYYNPIALLAPVCYSKIVASAPADTCTFGADSVALTAGDYLTVHIVQIGNASDDTEVAYALINIAQRA